MSDNSPVNLSEVTAAQTMYNNINLISVEMLEAVHAALDGRPTALEHEGETYISAGVMALYLSTLSDGIDEIRAGEQDPEMLLEKVFVLGAYLLGNSTNKGLPSIEELLTENDIQIVDDLNS